MQRLLADGADPDALYRVRTNRGLLNALFGTGGSSYATTPVQEGVGQAIGRGHLRSLELMLHAGGNPDLATPDRPPPLFRAARASHDRDTAPLVRLLLAHGASPRLTHDGKTVLGALASERATPPPRSVAMVADLLLEAGAPLGLGLCEAAAAGDGWLTLRLLDAGAEMDATCAVGDPPFRAAPVSAAATAGAVDIVDALLARGAPLEVPGSAGPLAAALTAPEPSLDVVRRLVQAGADRALVNAESTVFHAAAAHLGEPALLEALMSRPLSDAELGAALAAYADGVPLAPLGLDGWPLQAIATSVSALGLATFVVLFDAAGPEQVAQVLSSRGGTDSPSSSACGLTRSMGARAVKEALGRPKSRARDGIVRRWEMAEGQVTLWRHRPWSKAGVARVLDAPERCDPDGPVLRGLHRAAVHLALGKPWQVTTDEDAWLLGHGLYVVVYEDDRAVHAGWDFLAR